MLLALLLTMTQLSPESSSARLLPEESGRGLSRSGEPAVPGLSRVWVPYAVAGALTTVTALGLIIGLIAGRSGGLVGFAVAVLGGAIGGVIHLVCGIIGAVLAGTNDRLRKEARERAQPPPSAMLTQPMTLVLHF